MRYYRISIIEVLTDFATKGAQIDWDRLGVDDIPRFLYTRWKKVFAPNQRRFVAEFTAQEIEQLIRFEEFYIQREEDFPSHINELMKDVHWHSVCEYAGQLLDQLTYNNR